MKTQNTKNQQVKLSPAQKKVLNWLETHTDFDWQTYHRTLQILEEKGSIVRQGEHYEITETGTISLDCTGRAPASSEESITEKAFAYKLKKLEAELIVCKHEEGRHCPNESIYQKISSHLRAANLVGVDMPTFKEWQAENLSKYIEKELPINEKTREGFVQRIAKLQRAIESDNDFGKYGAKKAVEAEVETMIKNGLNKDQQEAILDDAMKFNEAVRAQQAVTPDVVIEKIIRKLQHERGYHVATLKSGHEVACTPPKKKKEPFAENFLGFIIRNTWNSDGYVPSGLTCGHLGNYHKLEDAQRACLVQFMIERPKVFSAHIRHLVIYGSGLHLDGSLLIREIKAAGFDVPVQISKSLDYNQTIQFNGEAVNQKAIERHQNTLRGDLARQGVDYQNKINDLKRSLERLQDELNEYVQ